MKTRCKPGDIAVIVNQRNFGKLVTVIQLYVPETRVDGTRWYSDSGLGPMWVVESLGGPLKSTDEDGEIGNHTTVAIPDSRLRPLRKGPGQDEMLRLTGKPKVADKLVVAKKRGRPAKQKEVSHV